MTSSQEHSSEKPWQCPLCKSYGYCYLPSKCPKPAAVVACTDNQPQEQR